MPPVRYAKQQTKHLENRLVQIGAHRPTVVNFLDLKAYVTNGAMLLFHCWLLDINILNFGS
jgi:hypothetical protein